MASKKYPYPLVECRWVDAETTSGWEAHGENKPTVPIVITVGFLIEDNEELISIASTVGDDRMHNARINIPRGMVKELKTKR